MTNDRFIELFDKHMFGQLFETETQELKEWMDKSEHNRIVFERLTDKKFLKNKFKELIKARQEDWLYILEKHPELAPGQVPIEHIYKKREIQVRRLMVAATASVILITSAFYLWMNARKQTKQIAKTEDAKNRFKNDVAAPDMVNATIILANGREIEIDSLTNSVPVIQGNVNIVKNHNGEIVYKSGSVSDKNNMVYNVLNNPRGSKVVNLTLSDGTKVWLNSGSSFKYPISFMGKDRCVEITGEAYFEVTKDHLKKFIVKSGDLTTVVLGTHFNVNNYPDEGSIKVTLLEGSVNVSNYGKTANLKPGDQVVANSNSSTLVILHSTDLDQVLDWKNGIFYFDGEDLESIMKHLARWYNVEVDYEAAISNRSFGGMISRNKKLSEVLKVLELSDVHFRIEGKKITVLK